VVLTPSPSEAPSATYRVVWVDENGESKVFDFGLSEADADDKVLDAKASGFHAYKAVEDPPTVPIKESVL
jgi:hypothetical protein